MAATSTPAQVPQLVVSDAGPLIHLDELGCLKLLSDFARVAVPASVWEEVSRHRPGALACPRVALDRSAAETPLWAQLAGLRRLFALDRAELDALHLACEIAADLQCLEFLKGTLKFMA